MRRKFGEIMYCLLRIPRPSWPLVTITMTRFHIHSAY
ncbi:hypothetical protein E2C01_029905 [Portunus trituberculatus]|uniref:Uncharacterized protein n=1 Tax=Portunus trituberculatus TaxID=210409 RepID=A0A5B7ET95_PORTR|nr:hypothetical protein [Portunus trituberculatus]